MPKHSAGIVPYRFKNKALEIFLVHPGGPFYAKKDLGAWTIPKGEISDGEMPFEVAKREFLEETGIVIEYGNPIELNAIKQKGGKIVQAWAVPADFDSSRIQSNTFSLEWPPKSGRAQEFPEVDRAGWFPLPHAKQKMLASQHDIIDQLVQILGIDLSTADLQSEESLADTISDESDGEPQLTLF